MYGQPWWEFCCISYTQDSLTIHLAKLVHPWGMTREGKGRCAREGLQAALCIASPTKGRELILEKWQNKHLQS